MADCLRLQQKRSATFIREIPGSEFSRRPLSITTLQPPFSLRGGEISRGKDRLVPLRIRGKVILRRECWNVTSSKLAVWTRLGARGYLMNATFVQSIIGDFQKFCLPLKFVRILFEP